MSFGFAIFFIRAAERERKKNLISIFAPKVP
jgi:hypothetical protein